MPYEEKEQTYATYHGSHCEMRPHGIGTKHGQAYALFYQFGGASRIGLPKAGQWLCLKTDAPNMQMKSYTQNTPETYYNRSYCTYSRRDHHRRLFRRHSSVILSLPSPGRRNVRVYQRYKRILRRFVQLHWRRRTDRMLGDMEPKRNPLRLRGWFSRLPPWCQQRQLRHRLRNRHCQCGRDGGPHL